MIFILIRIDGLQSSIGKRDVFVSSISYYYVSYDVTKHRHEDNGALWLVIGAHSQQIQSKNKSVCENAVTGT